MELHLDQNEADVTFRVLTNYLSDLRMEIGKTENYNLRQALKEDEETIKALIARLEALKSTVS
jgi:hypothetical protein